MLITFLFIYFFHFIPLRCESHLNFPTHKPEVRPVGRHWESDVINFVLVAGGNRRPDPTVRWRREVFFPDSSRIVVISFKIWLGRRFRYCIFQWLFVHQSIVCQQPRSVVSTVRSIDLVFRFVVLIGPHMNKNGHCVKRPFAVRTMLALSYFADTLINRHVSFPRKRGNPRFWRFSQNFRVCCVCPCFTASAARGPRNSQRNRLAGCDERSVWWAPLRGSVGLVASIGNNKPRAFHQTAIVIGRFAESQTWSGWNNQ